MKYGVVQKLQVVNRKKKLKRIVGYDWQFTDGFNRNPKSPHAVRLLSLPKTLTLTDAGDIVGGSLSPAQRHR